MCERASQYVRSKARVRVRPKRYFCDPSLAAVLLGATPERLLGDMQTLGMLFENLVLRDVRVFLNSIDHQLDLVRAAGVGASREQQETEREIVLTIRIPKTKPPAAG